MRYFNWFMWFFGFGFIFLSLRCGPQDSQETLKIDSFYEEWGGESDWEEGSFVFTER